PQRPGLEGREADRAGEHHIGRLEQRRAYHGVAHFPDPARAVDLAGLVLLRFSPKWAPTAFDLANRSGWSMADLKVIATTAPTPGIVIRRLHTASSRTVLRRSRCSVAYSARSAAPARSSGPATRSSMTWPVTSS